MMTDDTHAQHLRDKAKRGDVLTADEQATLVAWYVNQDQNQDQNGQANAAAPLAGSLWEALGKELENASKRLKASAEQFQTQAEKYEDLRRDAAVISEQIPKPPKTPKKH